jgi:hypothetical protein
LICSDAQVLNGILQHQEQTLWRGLVIRRIHHLAAQLVAVCLQHLEQRPPAQPSQEPVLERALEPRPASRMVMEGRIRLARWEGFEPPAA